MGRDRLERLVVVFLNSTDSFISIYFKRWLAQHA